MWKNSQCNQPRIKKIGLVFSLVSSVLCDENVIEFVLNGFQ